MAETKEIKTALISVFHKDGLEDILAKLHEQGVKFQMNITSLTGAYGPEPKERAEYLLEEGYYTYQGSDLHSLSAFKRTIQDKKVRKRIYRILQQK